MKISKEQYDHILTQPITKQIFMGSSGGSSGGGFSEAYCERLHKQLDEAFSIISGLQQNPFPDDPLYDPSLDQSHIMKIVERETEELQIIVKEINLGLLGKEPDEEITSSNIDRHIL